MQYIRELEPYFIAKIGYLHGFDEKINLGVNFVLFSVVKRCHSSLQTGHIR